MVDDAGAAGGPGGPGGPGIGGRSGFHGGFGSGIWGRGCGQDWVRGQGCGAHGGKAKDKEWIPVTKLGRLVKDKKIKSLEEIYLFSLPIKESEIIDFFLGASLKDEVLKIMPVQKQTLAGQRTQIWYRHCLGPVPKKLLMMAGIDDCYTLARGCTATLGNFAKATFDAISKTYSYLTPDLWPDLIPNCPPLLAWVPPTALYPAGLISPPTALLCWPDLTPQLPSPDGLITPNFFCLGPYHHGFACKEVGHLEDRSVDLV
ncbi:hypothetical protein QTO34_006697 [Cnephaeus nilssonii]|uniref:Small ribosomal subunit protein uS5 n=1 Tax=Cnephaeus nilssonii TaxID=3371016 RepID=A0AA40HL03_CNENI|nr:hypothetical protein QTO34_006697 [Eptesicus nilssonii]